MRLCGSPFGGCAHVRTTIVLGFVAMATGAVYLARVRMQAYRQSSVRDGLAQFSAAFRGVTFRRNC